MSGGLGGGDGGGLLWIDIRLLSLKSIGLLCGYLTEGAIVREALGKKRETSTIKIRGSKDESRGKRKERREQRQERRDHESSG